MQDHGGFGHDHSHEHGHHESDIELNSKQVIGKKIVNFYRHNIAYSFTSDALF